MNQFKLDNENINVEFHSGDSLKITSEFKFYHNKLKFRKEINTLQFLFKKYLDNPLQATGIRDSYLDEEYSNTFLILIFSTYENIKNLNIFMKKYKELEIDHSCFFTESNSEYIILLSKDIEGIKEGIHILEDIFNQILTKYFENRNFNEYIQIFPFKINNCQIRKR